MSGLRIGGLAAFSRCDWPGRRVATVFCQGCPWNCPYCHTQPLRPAGARPALAWPEVTAVLAARRHALDGVVFSGGEPTGQAALEDAIATVRAIGLPIGLHTAGIFPDRLAGLLPLVDWVGLDIKAPFDPLYGRLTGDPASAAKAEASLRHLLASGVDYEIRTTVCPELLGRPDLLRLMKRLSELGVRHYRLQKQRPSLLTPVPGHGVEGGLHRSPAAGAGSGWSI